MFYDKSQIQQAKQVSIVAYLESIGFAPVDSKGNSLVYNLREENTPSCYVNPQKNIFNDFGDTGGDVIKLVCHLHQCDFITAIGILLDFKGTHQNKSFSFNQSNHSHPFKESDKLNLTKVKLLENKALVSYLEGRGIPCELASKYCKEVYYTIQDKKYFSIAFANDAGGYELRNPYLKNCTSPKAITTIQGTTQSKRVVNVFEGFIDFLSSLVYFKTTKPQSDTIVLNSLSLVEATTEKLKSYEVVSLFLDNDTAGEKAVEQLKQAHPAIIDRAKIYEGYKDFNNMLINQLQKKK